MPSINKILVANRGEIAARVFRTCRDLGIRTVAVFSDADRAALHVRMADEAYRIGPSPSSESYLVMDAILDVAERSGADAVHPGYGFLSENASFAKKCADREVIFIGPPPSAIEAMGDKAAARRLMSEAGIPMAPGVIDAVETVTEATSIASEIGYPILVKAAAGGGGKGMRTVHDAADLSDAFEAAQREAVAAFGDGRVYIEKYIVQPRHIEIQILADSQGNAVHLFERECSIQRRHQKVIEESPSSILSDAERREMGQAAVQAALACGYTNAGTVEFLMDKDKNYYFMEMNTRLQVEHPVTEAVTGIDLVAEQIHVAQGGQLRFSQADLAIHGHAIECRVYAEDPATNFLPDPGTVKRHRPPAGPNVRVDAGVDEGCEIPLYYDPMISKVVTWGANRESAIRTMLRALDEYKIAGVQTTIPFCRYVLEHPKFRDGDFSTHFVADHFDPTIMTGPTKNESQAAAVAAVLAMRDDAASRTNHTPVSPESDEEWSRWAVNRRRRK